ncbi:hypothetical protein Q669_02950 [Labrenzia sp. C1B10]|nr:hypothetical protein Q669_02950 [Labrenzia sp. C1B10]
MLPPALMRRRMILVLRCALVCLMQSEIQRPEKIIVAVFPIWGQ